MGPTMVQRQATIARSEEQSDNCNFRELRNYRGGCSLDSSRARRSGLATGSFARLHLVLDTDNFASCLYTAKANTDRCAGQPCLLRACKLMRQQGLFEALQGWKQYR